MKETLETELKEVKVAKEKLEIELKETKEGLDTGLTSAKESKETIKVELKEAKEKIEELKIVKEAKETLEAELTNVKKAKETVEVDLATAKETIPMKRKTNLPSQAFCSFAPPFPPGLLLSTLWMPLKRRKGDAAASIFLLPTFTFKPTTTENKTDGLSRKGLFWVFLHQLTYLQQPTLSWRTLCPRAAPELKGEA